MKNSIKRVVSIVLVSLMIINMFGIIPAFAETSASYTNFALGKTVEFGYMEEIATDASWGVEAINAGLGALTDGVNDSTNWAVNNADPANYPDNPYIGLRNTNVAGPYSFTVDLGEVHPVSKASLHSITIASWSLWTTKSVTYSTSVDGEIWQTVGTVAAEDAIKTNATSGSTAIGFYNFELTFDTVNARYVKVDFETNPNSNGVHGFGEFEVYGKNIAAGNTDISFEYGSEVATNASWSASAVQGGVYALTNGVKYGPNFWVNNSTSDPTQSNPYIGLNKQYVTGPYAFVTDLGEATSVGRIHAYFYDRTDWSIATPATVNFAVSVDGVDWQSVGSVASSEAVTKAVTDVNNPTGQQPTIYDYQLACSADNVRYVKVEFDAHSDSTVRIGLGEIEIYEGAPSTIPDGNIIEAVVMMPEALYFNSVAGTMTYNENLYYIEGSFSAPYVDDMTATEADGVISFSAENTTTPYNIMDTTVLCSAKFVVLNEGELTTVTSVISEVLFNSEAQSTTSEVYINSLGNSCGEDVTWSFDEATGTLTISGTGTMYDFTTAVKKPWLSISNKITNVVIEEGVTTVGDYAFDNCLNIASVSLPSTLTKISTGAFAGSEFKGSALTSIEIPDGVTHIGQHAFSFSGLTSIEIPDSVTSMGDYALAYCKNLTSAKLPASTTRIGSGFFAGCKQLTNITIPEGVTTIGDAAFESCYALTSVEIPDSVTSIEGAAFAWCVGLTSVELSQNLTTLGDSVFLGCRVLTDVELPETLETIGSAAFSNCESLTSISIPASVTSIGERAFEGVAEGFTAYVRTGTAGYTYAVDNSINYVVVGGVVGDNATYKFDATTGTLTISGTGDTYSYHKEVGAPWFDKRLDITKVVVEEGITGLGDSLFYYYSNLTEVELPDSLTSIGSSTFSRCIALTDIELPANLEVIGSSAFQRSTGLASITFPEGLTTIGTSAFTFCTGLTSVEIPDSVTSLGVSAFGDCSGLKTAVIGDGITSIPDGLFSACDNLTDITISANTTSIGNYAFAGTGIISFKLPDGLETIGEGAFASSALASVTIPKSVTSIGEGAFDSLVSTFNARVYIKTEGYAHVKNNGINYTLFNAVGEDCAYILDQENFTITIAGEGAMYDFVYEDLAVNTPWYTYRSMIKEIIIEDGITSIGSYAFKGFEDTAVITIADSVKIIADHAFEYCSLADIVIPYGVEAIGSYAFTACAGITDIVIPDSVVYVGEGAFQGCYRAMSLTLSQNLKTIEAYTFDSCEAISSIVIPEGVTYIGAYAFVNNYGATELSLPDTLEYMAEGAFGACISLSNVDIPDGVTELSDYNFAYCESLAEVKLPSNLTYIGNEAFSGCYSLLEIDIPETVETISFGAFGYCESLSEVVIPEGVTTIGDYAFATCMGLRTAVVPASVTEMGYDVFFETSEDFVAYGYCDTVAQERILEEGFTFKGFGDTNGDGTLTISDATDIQKHLARISTVDYDAAIDVNGDGKLSIRDVTYIQMYITKMIDEFPITA